MWRGERSRLLAPTPICPHMITDNAGGWVVSLFFTLHLSFVPFGVTFLIPDF